MFTYVLFNIYKSNKLTNTDDKINIIMANLLIIIYTLSHRLFIGNLNIIDEIKSNLQKEQCNNLLSVIYAYDNYIMIISNYKNNSVLPILNDFSELLKKKIAQKNQKINHTQYNNVSINFIIENDYNCTHIEINNKLVNFIDYVKSISKKHKVDKKINIYTVYTKINKIINKI
jgi:hypothetical protein